MQLILEEEAEAFVFENEWDVAVPVSFEEIDGKLSVTCYPKCRDAVQAWLLLHASDPFSEVALRSLWRHLAPFVSAWGYRAERFRDRWGYILRPKASLPLPLKRTDVRKLKKTDEDCNDTTYDVEATVEDGRLVYGALYNGRVVSVAVTHAPLPRKGSILEVGVETVPSARGKGYASACLSALTAHMLSKGVTPEYRCTRVNTASLRTAQRAGYETVGRFYYYVLRKTR